MLHLPFSRPSSGGRATPTRRHAVHDAVRHRMIEIRVAERPQAQTSRRPANAAAPLPQDDDALLG